MVPASPLASPGYCLQGLDNLELNNPSLLGICMSLAYQTLTYWLNDKDRGLLLNFFGFQFNICLQLRGKPHVLGFSFLRSMLDNAVIVFKRLLITTNFKESYRGLNCTYLP